MTAHLAFGNHKEYPKLSFVASTFAATPFFLFFPDLCVRKRDTHLLKLLAMSVLPTLPKCPSSGLPQSPAIFSPSLLVSVKLRTPPSTASASASLVARCSAAAEASQSEVAVVNGRAESTVSERNEIRFGLPSKGRMAADTLDLLKVT